MKNLIKIDFIGYTIEKCGTGLYKLSGNIETVGDVWKDDLGIFSSLYLARKAALICFMMENYSQFYAVIGRRLLYRMPIYGEWFILAATLEAQGFKIPKCLTKSTDGNSYILINKQNF